MERRYWLDEIAIMRASTLLVATWLIWITGKGRLSKYWALATSSGSASAEAQAAPGSGDHATSLPGFPSWKELFSWINPLPDIGDFNAGGW